MYERYEKMTTKMLDGRGRVSLGSEYANSMVLVDDSDPRRIVITPAVAVPVNEAWLHTNKEAMGSVIRGIEQAKNGELVNGPDISCESDEIN